LNDLRQDAVNYGQRLFDLTFADATLRTALMRMPAGERLLIVADEASSAIPWEYLREPDGTLLATRLNVLRGLPENQRRASRNWSGNFELLAVPASPINDTHRLNTENEWANLVRIAQRAKRTLALSRVRPAELSQLERALGNASISWLWFMGHSGLREDGSAVLLFEDTLGMERAISVAEFARALDESVQFVLLNSCQSAAAGASGEATAFGNIARGLVQAGVPYALGMQASVPDDAAVKLSEALFDFLLKGRGIEEAVMRARRALASEATLTNGAWLAGIPVLYTCQREPLPGLQLHSGAPAITPSPDVLMQRYDMTALGQTSHFVGRESEMAAVQSELLQPKPKNFVLLHGLGGTGKTALARAVAERAGWHFDDCGLAISFETFARLGADGSLTVNPQFADGFISQLAGFYGLDAAKYSDKPIELQEAIVQQRQRQRSLLVLDNLETLLDALDKRDPHALALAAFVRRLGQGNGAVLITSRALLPTDWGSCAGIEVSGLSDAAGARLFHALLRPHRQRVTLIKDAEKLSVRVGGHPQSVRLLAGRYDEVSSGLPAFMADIETELQRAELQTPDSLRDSARQRTLYACIAYSVLRLSPTERETLCAAAGFRAPFIAEFAAAALDDEANAPARLWRLLELSLLEGRSRNFAEGALVQFELHPTVRWYAARFLPQADEAMLERRAKTLLNLARGVSRDADALAQYNRDARLRALVRDALPDFDAALSDLSPREASSLAYHLSQPLIQMGSVPLALAYLQQSAKLCTELGDTHNAAVTESKIADVLVRLGRVDEAMTLYDKSLKAIEQLGDVRAVAVTRANRGQALIGQGRGAEGLCDLLGAYAALQHRYPPDAATMQSLLTQIRSSMGIEAFDQVWAKATTDSQPDWLRNAPASQSSEPAGVSPQQLAVIVSNTAAVLTFATDKADEWGGVVQQTLGQAQANGDDALAEFLGAILELLQGNEGNLPADHAYALQWQAIFQQVIENQSDANHVGRTEADEVMPAVRAFVGASDAVALRRVVEEQQATLFRPEAEEIFEQNIVQAQDDAWRERLQFSLQLLRACKQVGIAAAFAQLAQAQPAPAAEQQDEAAQLRAAIVNNTRVVLRETENESQRAEWWETLMQLRDSALQEGDNALFAFIEEVVSLLDAKGNPIGLGGKLDGMYAAAWQAILQK
jgi:tetratricopeptide (TPR) repeat protein